MPTCDQIRPLLYRIAEQEADPGEAIEVARHLPRCTACKILLARERRLALLLEREWIDLAVDETFVRTVMDTLPKSPPRRAAPIRVLRGLKLACLAGLLFLCGTSAGPSPTAPLDSPWFVLPTLDIESPAATPAPAAAAAALAVRAVAAILPPVLTEPFAVKASIGVGFLLLCALLASGCLGLAFAGSWLLRPMAAPASRAALTG